MQATNIVKIRAAKLQDVLGTMGYSLNQSQCLSVVSDIEKHPDCKTPIPPIGDSQRTAEQYLDIVIQGFMEHNYEKATRFTEEKYLVNFSVREFKRSVLNAHEDLGAYMHRKFLGSLSAESHPDEADNYPDHIRYVWRGIFEKNEGLLIMGLYSKNGTYYTSDISCK